MLWAEVTPSLASRDGILSLPLLVIDLGLEPSVVISSASVGPFSFKEVSPDERPAIVAEAIRSRISNCLVSAVTLLAVPTIVYGGISLLGILTQGMAGSASRALALDETQEALWRAGHAHAGSG